MFPISYLYTRLHNENLLKRIDMAVNGMAGDVVMGSIFKAPSI